jgi:hypothetical protein
VLLLGELHELSDQLDVKSNKDHAVYSNFFSSKRKCKPEGYHAVCVQYVALFCCLSAKQMAKSKHCKVTCKVPTEQGRRLDHATKLEASLPLQLHSHSSQDRRGPALCTAPALLQNSLPRLVRSDCRGDRGAPAPGTAPALLRASLSRLVRSD